MDIPCWQYKILYGLYIVPIITSFLGIIRKLPNQNFHFAFVDIPTYSYVLLFSKYQKQELSRKIDIFWNNQTNSLANKKDNNFRNEFADDIYENSILSSG